MSVPNIAYQKYSTLVGRLSSLQGSLKQSSGALNKNKILNEITKVREDLSKVTDSTFSNQAYAKIEQLYTTRSQYNNKEVLDALSAERSDWHVRVEVLGLKPKLAERSLVKNGAELYAAQKELNKLDNDIAYAQRVLSEQEVPEQPTIDDIAMRTKNKQSLLQDFQDLDSVVTRQSLNMDVDKTTLRELANVEKIYLGSNVYDPTLVNMPSDLSSPPIVQGNISTIAGSINFLDNSKTNLIDSELYDPRDIEYVVPVFKNVKEVSYMYLVSYGHSLIAENKNNNVADSLPTINNPFGSNRRYNQFTLTGLTEEYHEKYELTDTLGLGQLATFFGVNAETWALSGTLINDLYHAWYPKFRTLWDQEIKASVLVEKKKHLVIVIPGASVLLECYPIALTMSLSADTEQAAYFNMALYIKGVRNFPKVSVGFSNDDYGNTQEAMAKALASMRGGKI